MLLALGSLTASRHQEGAADRTTELTYIIKYKYLPIYNVTLPRPPAPFTPEPQSTVQTVIKTSQPPALPAVLNSFSSAGK